jgi:hypothetical protein
MQMYVRAEAQSDFIHHHHVTKQFYCFLFNACTTVTAWAAHIMA